METRLLSQEGKEIGTVDLSDNVFGVEINEGLIHRALVYQLSNARQNVAHTKNRGERRGSTRKIYKQKGTGKARAGSNRSPLRKKGGVAFGPRNTINFKISMNKKERKLALFCTLASKLRDNKLIVLDSLNFSEIKTKNMVNVLSKLPYEKTALLALGSKNENIEKSSSNIPALKTLTVDYLNVADLLKYNTLILLKDSLDKLNSLNK